MMEVITRQEAIEQGRKEYFTGEPCGNGHLVEKWVLRNRCKQCKLNADRRYTVNNREKINAQAREYLEKNREDVNKRQRERIRENAEYNRFRTRKWRLENPERYAAQQIYHQSVRRKLVNKSKWAFKHHHLEMKNLAIQARKISKETKIKHHLDHIVPLKHAKICGLHVPWNMQIIPAKENLLKSNKWETN